MTDVVPKTSDQTPDFIYGGPFVKRARPDPLIDTVTPRNVQLQAIFQRSFAYFTVRERLPIIITKVIDYMARSKAEISSRCGASDQDIKEAIQYCTQLKNDIVTNKLMQPLTVDSDEARRWNKWIAAQDQPYYFTAIWIFTECYVYRRLREAFELNGKLKTYDPFQVQKQDAFKQNMEAMSAVARKVTELVQKDTNKESLILLLKLALWANQCDLSLSVGGEQDQVVDPFENVASNSTKLLVDDSAKIADFVLDKAGALTKKLAESKPVTAKCSCNRLAAARGMTTFEIPEEPPQSPDAPASPEKPADPENPDQPPEYKPPCPSKATAPPYVMFDIICDNSGYELFTDLCLGHFLLAKGIVQKVRYHVKEIPWFVSDVTPPDFQYVVQASANANFVKELPQKPEVEGAEPEPPSDFVSDGTPLDKDPSKFLTSKQMQALGKEWQKYLADGSFLIEADSFWTSPHIYKDMKKYDEGLYKKMQFPVVALFKGDLNYRKLVGEMNWNPTTPFEQALQGFIPAPLAALRTVKADLVCGLPKGRWEDLQALDDKWMEKGEYGLIQFCPKKEDLKVSDAPCAGFGGICKGVC